MPFAESGSGFGHKTPFLGRTPELFRVKPKIGPLEFPIDSVGNFNCPITARNRNRTGNTDLPSMMNVPFQPHPTELGGARPKICKKTFAHGACGSRGGALKPSARRLPICLANGSPVLASQHQPGFIAGLRVKPEIVLRARGKTWATEMSHRSPFQRFERRSRPRIAPSAARFGPFFHLRGRTRPRLRWVRP